MRLMRGLTKHRSTVEKEKCKKKRKKKKGAFVTIKTLVLSCFFKPVSHCYNRKCRQAVRQQKKEKKKLAFMSLVITTAGPLLIAIRSTRHTMGLCLIIS